MSCSTSVSSSIIYGQVLNISQSGCMVRINGLEAEDDSMTLSIIVPDDNDPIHLELRAEHLWTSKYEGACYHGFKFTEPSTEKSEILSGYLARLARLQQVEVKHATA